MKIIPISKNSKLSFIIDDEDLSKLDGYYFAIGGRDRDRIYAIKRISLSHLILQPDDNKMIDHINGNPLDNRKTNLRQVTNRQNQYNRKLNKNNTSGFKGVSVRKDRKKWRAKVVVDGKHVQKLFDSPIEAAKYYNELAKKYYGDCARLNDI